MAPGRHGGPGCDRMGDLGAHGMGMSVTIQWATDTRASFSVEREDRHRWLTWLSLTLLAIAAGMAVFGLPPVDLHGPLHRFGIMDPFCGGTRAARYTALGQWDMAWKYNPLGIVAVVAVLVLSVRATIGWLTNRWFTLTVAWSRHGFWIAGAVATILLVLLEIRQQGRADLLMQGTHVFGQAG
jgi:hypothetical protein